MGAGNDLRPRIEGPYKWLCSPVPKDQSPRKFAENREKLNLFSLVHHFIVIKMVKVEIVDEANSPYASTSSSRTGSTDSLSSVESDITVDESFLDRVAALVDIVPPTTRHSIASKVSKTASVVKKTGKVVGNIVWIVTTSALLVVLPLALALEDDSKIAAQEREMMEQQQGAQVCRNTNPPFVHVLIHVPSRCSLAVLLHHILPTSNSRNSSCHPVSNRCLAPHPLCFMTAFYLCSYNVMHAMYPPTMRSLMFPSFGYTSLKKYRVPCSECSHLAIEPSDISE